MACALTYDPVVSWDAELTALTERIAAPLFTRPEPRQALADPVRALLADVPHKNSRQLADHIGHATAYRFEHLLGRAKWDADALRNEVRSYVPAHPGHDDAVAITDDTAAIEKGDKPAGVADQYCGLTGQAENCQVMPMLTDAASTPRHPGTRSSTGACTCPRPGAATGHGENGPQCPTTSSSAPNPNW